VPFSIPFFFLLRKLVPRFSILTSVAALVALEDPKKDWCQAAFYCHRLQIWQWHWLPPRHHRRLQMPLLSSPFCSSRMWLPNSASFSVLPVSIFVALPPLSLGHNLLPKVDDCLNIFDIRMNELKKNNLLGNLQ
jgi:hypothetical protein